MSTDLAVRLTTFRQAQHWSQQALATRLAVSVSTVARWEHGTVAPSALALVALKRVGFRAGQVS